MADDTTRQQRYHDRRHDGSVPVNRCKEPTCRLWVRRTGDGPEDLKALLRFGPGSVIARPFEAVRKVVDPKGDGDHASRD